jgi:hypothetical protein
MTTFSAERPLFFEGQYLGAADLAAIVDYLRTTSARQNLGHHTWGIAIGLDLVEQAISDTAVEYYVQPGVAIDGYGRIIVVSEPARIETEQFVSIGSGNVDIWIRYAQNEFSAVRQGFNVCSSQDDYSRINETYALEVGSKTSILERQSGVTVNSMLVNDAREALVSVNPAAPLLCDASIPHQQLPVNDDDAYWLIPLGHVKWSAATSSFLPLVDPAKKAALEAGNSPETADQVYESVQASRIKRRFIGVVAESIFVAESLIRLRERAAPFDPAKENDEICGQFSVQSRDLNVCDGIVKPKELIWLEGHTRVRGDLRLLNGRLEFRDETGSDYIARTIAGSTQESIYPALLQRKARSLIDKNAGIDIQVLLGDSAAVDKNAGGKNRFTVGSITFTGDDLCHLESTEQSKVFIQDNGRMGIGTFAPETILTAPLSVRGFEEELVVPEGADPVSVMRVMNIEGQGGALAWQMNLGPDLQSLSFDEVSANNSRLYLEKGGNVGIGTTDPEAKLEIVQVPASVNGSPLGSDLWFRAGDGGDSGRVWIECGSQAAPLLVLSDKDNPPRIQFQQIASDDLEAEKAPAHSSWFGHARGLSPNLSIMGGNLGIGIDNPQTSILSVQQNGGAVGLYSGINGGHVWVGFYTNGAPGSARSGWLGFVNDGATGFTIHNEKPNADILLSTERNVGIGTQTPVEKLDVRGNIKLGTAGDLFAAGSLENLRIVRGQVADNGTPVNGNGFTAARISVGHYRIRFEPDFADIPIVTATVIGDVDNLISIDSVTSSVCNFIIYGNLY